MGFSYCHVSERKYLTLCEKMMEEIKNERVECQIGIVHIRKLIMEKH